MNLINKIHLADCMDFMPSIPDKSVEMTLTDIPYGECDKKSGGLRIIDKGDADRCDFDLEPFVNEIKRITRGSIYIFCGIHQISQIYDVLRTDMTSRLCHWQKINPSPMNAQHIWLSATENCVFARAKGAVFNEFYKPNVWRHGNGESKEHPTQKPIQLFQYLIRVSSNENDVIFDPCIGSGTTSAAAVTTGRNFIGIEKNPEWHKLARQRTLDEINSDIDCPQRRQI